ncbi:MAG TPA: hypothetical protein HPP83_01940, partial [Candidatus Hydrogenedentes bacterium]|nr:hypothetical protein [Candidatus Hydrogenedentota bacterium]
MKRRLCIGIAMLLIASLGYVYICRSAAWALPTAPDAENTRALQAFGEKDEKRSPVIAYQRILLGHKVPICYENLLPADKNSVVEMEFRIRENQTLGFSLEQLVEKSQGQLQYQRIRDVLCIYPTNPGKLPNIMDRPVSLELEEVSAWEAFKALGKAMNANKPSE